MGQWVMRVRNWYEVAVINCHLCGKMLPGRVWRGQVGDQERDFCNPDCEEMYFSYWTPRYGGRNEPGAAVPFASVADRRWSA
jgi:hypothetical protein